MATYEKADTGEDYNNCGAVIRYNESYIYQNTEKGEKCSSIDTGDGTETA